jgi:toxin YoeB
LAKKRKPTAITRPTRDAIFQDEFRADLRYWVETDRRTALRVFELVEAVMREPFSGVGKPEPLKYLGADVWSRRITQEHRLVYLVQADRIDFLQARYHYSWEDHNTRKRARRDLTRYTASGKTWLSAIAVRGQEEPQEPRVFGESDYELPSLVANAGASVPEAVAQVIETLIDRIDRSHQPVLYIPTTIAIDRRAEAPARGKLPLGLGW